MGEVSYPFETGTGTAVDEARWRYLARAFSTSGVVGLSTRDTSDTSLKVSLGSGLTMNMADGAAIIDGIGYEATAGPLSKTASANGNTNPRIDRFILKLDTNTGNTISASIKQGTPGSTPLPPALTYDLAAGTIEVPLARATCPGSGSAQNYTGLVDERMFIGSAPIVGEATDAGAWHPFRPGDILYRRSSGLLVVWDGSAETGMRPEQFAGVPAEPSGQELIGGGVEMVYATITIPDLSYPYRVSFSGHFEMAAMGVGNWVVARVRQDDAVSGAILTSAQGAPSGSNGLSPVHFQSEPEQIAAGASHTFYMTVQPNVAADFFWGVDNNRFAAMVTPVW